MAKIQIKINGDPWTIDKSQIPQSALSVLRALKQAGYQAYLVGGSVRDLLLGLEPKDFDVATDALPEAAKALFEKSILIGRRFRLLHVRFQRQIIEVATFRRAAVTNKTDRATGETNPLGFLRTDNEYGCLEDDVWRRDFTVNAFYYDPDRDLLIDHTNGLADLRAGLMRIIGDPSLRLREDPVRILRAIRLAAKLGFQIEQKTQAHFINLVPLLQHIAPARRFDECLKLFLLGNSVEVFASLRRYYALDYLFPSIALLLALPTEHHRVSVFISRLCENTDQRIQIGKIVNPAYLFAALLWFPFQQHLASLLADQCAKREAIPIAIKKTLTTQQASTAISRHYLHQIESIWSLQFQLPKKRRAAHLLKHPKFRAAYDFLLLRAVVEPRLRNLGKWWTDFYEGESRTIEP